ncbi:MAG TPA: efflux RND transporter periplasmic adaptor subunit [Gemmatimonadales bacterium]|nr:efflux RND transporter periplasmic adaptor subunit [Gemmatimonadales bacterium]
MRSFLRRVRTLALLLSPVGCIVTVACGGAEGSAEEAGKLPSDSSGQSLNFSAAQVQHGKVRWAPVVMREVAATLELPGKLVPNEDRTARLGAPAQGRVSQVHVQPGARVKRRAPLVTLWSQEASAAQADYDKAHAELNSRRAAAAYARTAKERAERLLQIKAAARQDVERAQADDELAQAQLAQAEAELARSRSAIGHLSVSSPSGTMVLRSPTDGIVLSRDVVPGAVVEPGAQLVSVTDPATLWLEVSAPDRAAGTVAPGSPVRFIVPAFPADTFETRVQSVAGALDPETRTLGVRALVNNQRGKLRPEMFATVWLDQGRREKAVVLPESAVQQVEGKPVVFVASPDGKGGARFERREVVVGGTTRGETQILRGLSDQDTVVVEGAFAVKSELARSKMAEG